MICISRLWPAWTIRSVSLSSFAISLTPGLANSRKNFCCNPVLKLFGFFELAAEDERVETGFVDNDGITSLTCHRDLRCQLILFIYMFANSIRSITVSQCSRYILTHKPRFSINSKSTKISKLRMKRRVKSADLRWSSGFGSGGCFGLTDLHLRNRMKSNKNTGRW